ncbi:carbohydrate-binding protein [Stieleria varia]|uniref:Uncharacterized protein n=1 Tax=Stieleria varia TaxID=2528005 RepID=A0A5C6B4D5_9BACT|nr:hypothetical protein [Stieleria varia]TWU06422.1 hypothetical protein Pla52n_21430 [Stieleria varia]
MLTFSPASSAITLAVIALFGTLPTALPAQDGESSPVPASKLPADAKWAAALSGPGVNVYVHSRELFLVPKAGSLQARKLSIPRLCAPIRSLRWLDDAQQNLSFAPEPDHWVFSWKKDVQADAMIKVELDEEPVVLAQCPATEPAGDGSIMLHAHDGKTFGEKLRYEPQWYKNTIGYWTIPTDYATWDLKVSEAGEYSVAVLQGCGAGHGGSEAMITLLDGETTVAKLSFETIDTGHFQNFRWNHLGNIRIEKPGDYQLRIGAVKIAKGALLDARAIHLVKQAK